MICWSMQVEIASHIAMDILLILLDMPVLMFILQTPFHVVLGEVVVVMGHMVGILVILDVLGYLVITESIMVINILMIIRADRFNFMAFRRHWVNAFSA